MITIIPKTLLNLLNKTLKIIPRDSGETLE